MDDEAWEVLDVFAKCVMINIISVFGMVGNCINIIVLRQHGFKESTNIVLLALSVSDLAFCIMLPITRLVCIVRHFDEPLALTINAFATVYLFMPKYVCLGTSFWYVALIAVERFTAVFFPFKVSNIFTSKVMKFLVVAIFLFGLFAISPTFFAFTYGWTYDNSVNATVAIVNYTQFYRDNQAFLDYYMWVGMNNTFCSISMITVLACCLAIGFKLIRLSIKREQMTTQVTGFDIKIVRMLITVCAVYLFVQIPTITMFSYFRPNFIFVSPIHKFFNDVCDILYVTNASVNFIVYVTMSKKFNATYRRLFGCKK